MNKRIRKKHKTLLYQKYMEDIVSEISCNKNIRRILNDMPYNTTLEISEKSNHKFNKYISDILKQQLIFYVSKVRYCTKRYIEGAVIFKFTTEYKKPVEYSWNNLHEFTEGDDEV
ncbi:MAG: hypothetical protein IJ446_08760 [Oscillospiraceae bacterium]|nr:hypothetical protein [Oscillospiraceae bacterium]